MTLKQLIDLTHGRELTKSYPKADGNYIWDYKILTNPETNTPELYLIPSNTGKAGYKDKVSVQELLDYILKETDPTQSGVEVEALPVVGVEGLTIAKV